MSMYKKIEALVAKWQEIADRIWDGFEIYQGCANELEAIVQTSKPLHAVGVSVLLSMSDGCILLGKRKANTAAGLLSTPGGRLELGEDPWACARREFREECGAQLYGDIRLLAVRSHNRFGSGPYLMFYMHATGYTGVIENKEPDKCERWSWYDIRYIDPVTTTEPKDILDLLVWGPDGRMWYKDAQDQSRTT